ncbi:MAG: hypothetical protein A2Y88_03300 [Chloroflexi bacterium RBG_13_48_10]|nr:MAG: hypothetical protein A2Y88_03300 [Chloroflexi bacterium RBG_13_48_10]
MIRSKLFINNVMCVTVHEIQNKKANRNEFFKLIVLFGALIEPIIHSSTTRVNKINRVVKFDFTAIHKLIVMFPRLSCILMRKSAVPVMEGCLFAREQFAVARTKYGFSAT